MANELQITLKSRLANGEFVDLIEGQTYQVTQAAIGGHFGVVTVGTSEEDVAVGDVSTLGWLYLKNLDSTNYVTYGPKDTTMKAFGRLEPGEFAMLRLEPGITIRWKADTAAVKVLTKIYED